MIEVYGRANVARCFTDELASDAREQIRCICDEIAFKDSKIRIMPDVHAGKGCTVGTTMTIKDKVVPNMVGVDIGCGMETVRLGNKEISYADLDKLIKREIPAGHGVRKTYHRLAEKIDLTRLHCFKNIEHQKALLSIGTLGGGNHFIEVDRDEEGHLYLVVHSGSRHLGVEVANYYQELARKDSRKIESDALIAKLRAQGRDADIENELKRLKSQFAGNKELSYLQNELFNMYIDDMKLVQEFATINRRAITDSIIKGLGLSERERFTTIHNYIDTESMILRKGAVSAKSGEKLLIPMNMRDGSLICIGRGNEDWNFSAPHGAGRLLSRGKAKETLDLETYKKEMEGIYTTCVTNSTIDESPMAYKNMETIMSQITPTVTIERVIKPVYNFKSGA